jgi:protein-L-isoaspartate(D-aspartate) O-methyltransferase
MLRWIVLAAAVLWAVPQASADEFAEARQQMLTGIAAQAEAAAPLTGVEEIDERVLGAMASVPRHLFVPGPLQPFAYLPTPLPLGYGQNLASPYLVALMTHLADIQPGDRVFETGTGAGYHAAVIARLAEKIVSVEVVPEIADEARIHLARARVGNVETHIGDGYYGWPKGAPYDVILVKEALDHVPDPLMEQLAPGGRLVLPLGPLDDAQELTVIRKGRNGEVRRRQVLSVRFSPLQGGQRL